MNKWNIIKTEYIRGGTSYRKLAEKYEVPFSTLRKKAASEKWTDLRNRKAHKRDTEILGIIASEEAEEAVEISSIADRLAIRIKEGIEDGRFIVDAPSVRAISAALRDIKELRGRKAQLDIEEQLARIEKLRKEAQADEENKEIHVVISDDLKSYSE